MNPESIRNRAANILNAIRPEQEEEEVSELAAAFEADMKPVRDAIVSALKAGDAEALKGLRAMLPHLLSDVNKSPALADHLAHQLGKAFLGGLAAPPKDAL
jgi:ribosomal protein S1